MNMFTRFCRKYFVLMIGNSIQSLEGEVQNEFKRKVCLYGYWKTI